MKRSALYMGVTALLLGGMLFVHLSTGATYFSKWQLLHILLGGGTTEEMTTVFDFRMVRAVLAALIGAGLAMSGTVFQTISHNELAGPGLLGVNAGAGLAVTICIFMVPESVGIPLWGLPTVAMLGALITAIGIYRLAYRRGRQTSRYALVLNGISVAAGIHALQLFFIVRLGPEKFQTANAWIIGRIFGTSWEQVGITALLLFAIGTMMMKQAMTLNILSLGTDSVIGLGKQPEREQRRALLLAVAAAATCVSIGGSIGFVGLIAPHVARRLVGVDHRQVIPMAALCGALLVVTADWLGRVVVAPDELLVGIVVALIGAPYFLYILARKKR